jgi:hypothetical protein
MPRSVRPGQDAPLPHNSPARRKPSAHGESQGTGRLLQAETHPHQPFADGPGPPGTDAAFTAGIRSRPEIGFLSLRPRPRTGDGKCRKTETRNPKDRSVPATWRTDALLDPDRRAPPDCGPGASGIRPETPSEGNAERSPPENPPPVRVGGQFGSRPRSGDAASRQATHIRLPQWRRSRSVRLRNRIRSSGLFRIRFRAAKAEMKTGIGKTGNGGTGNGGTGVRGSRPAPGSAGGPAETEAA